MSDPFDPSAAERALEALLRALGAPLDSDAELRETPRRVAQMFANELLDGYRADVRAILRDGVESEERAMVLLTDARFTFFCPHHMLPSRGRAHIAYLPGSRVVGLGTLVRVLEAYAHRLVLQETLGRQLAESLIEHLGARGAAVMIRAEHECLSSRGEKQRDAAVVTAHFAGALDPESFYSALGAFSQR